jgi:septal ring factor EnvC (AmiA/AmiB activator)
MKASRRDPSTGLQDVQKKTKKVEVDIHRAADHAAVISTVLTHALPDEVLVGDVARAVEQTEELEDKLVRSAETLADVTAELGREIEKRRNVTEKLTESRAHVDKLTDEIESKRTP